MTSSHCAISVFGCFRSLCGRPFANDRTTGSTPTHFRAKASDRSCGDPYTKGHSESPECRFGFMLTTTMLAWVTLRNLPSSFASAVRYFSRVV